ncbi:MAG TPA: nitroreductase family protein [Vicinamibacterales bacterium]|nr:nitroreductase family protein [Vicinamibacterales bacterium]
MSTPHHPKVADADHDVHELIRHRWSPRAFDPERAVSRSDLLRLFEAARWAPSSLNEQPWRFVVVERRDPSTVWQDVLASLTPANRSWAVAAPVLVLASVRLTLERNESPNPLAWYDAGQAVALLTLQATAQGLSVRQMEGFDRDHARRACQVPEGFDPIVMMAIGYAGDPDTLASDKHRAAERAPRKRRALGDFVFEETWGRLYQREDA